MIGEIECVAVEAAGFLDEYFSEGGVAGNGGAFGSGATQEKGGDGFCFRGAEFEIRHGVAGKMRMWIAEVREQCGGEEFFRDVLEADAIC